MNTYRVEKDGMTHYAQPQQLRYYADNGYTIYKTVEMLVTDVDGEMRSAEDANTHSAIIGNQS